MKKIPVEPARRLTAEEYLELSRKDVTRAVDAIMAGFDFGKAAKALKGCDWRYHGAKASPGIFSLKKIARSILQSAIQSGAGCTTTQGPLRATVIKYESAVCTATLTLQPVWKSEVYIDGRVIFSNRRRKYAPASAGKKVGN